MEQEGGKRGRELPPNASFKQFFKNTLTSALQEPRKFIGI